MSQNWYYARGNQQMGPVTIDQLKGLLAAGQVHSADLVWTEGMANWAAAHSVQELTSAPAPAAPIAQPAVSQPAYVNPAPVTPQPVTPQPAYTNPAPTAPIASTYIPSPYATGQVVNAPPWGGQSGGVISYGPSVQYANFGMRFVAWFIDFVAASMAGGLIAGVIIAAVGIAGNDPNAQGVGLLFTQLIAQIIYWLYYAIMESSKTQGTLGKMAMGLKVTDTEGGPISFGKATGRYFGKFLSCFILGIGYLMMLWTQRSQTLHDTLAGTLVVKKTP